MMLALLCLMAALLSWPDRPHPLPTRQPAELERVDSRVGLGRVVLVGSAVVAAVLVIWPGAVISAVGAGVVAGGLGWGERRRAAAGPRRVRGEVALVCDLWAAGLDIGLPVGGALSTALEVLTRDGPADPTVRRLGQVAGLLRVGADVDRAWQPADPDPVLAPLAAAARRSSRVGADLADAVREQARVARRAEAGADERRAQRAGVLMTAPLTLCFLPAFVCLGLAPVVIALVGTLDLGR